MEEIKILTPDNLDDIIGFEIPRLPGEGFDKEIAAWHAPWRQEALEHYLPQGWSFIKKVDDQVAGYILAQPFLFFKSWTQVLWIEHVSALSQEVGEEMIHIAYRWAKDKHLQKVFFGKSLPFAKEIKFCTVHQDEDLFYLNTTRV